MTCQPLTPKEQTMMTEPERRPPPPWWKDMIFALAIVAALVAWCVGVPGAPG